MEFREFFATLLALATLAVGFDVRVEPCLNRTFHRRMTKDNLVFPGGETFSGIEVKNRTDCFSRCQWRFLCNSVLYNSVTSACKLYSDASPTDGIPESGWQYYAASCINYPVVISAGGVDKGDACDDGYHALLACPPQSCFNGGTWINLRTVCTPTLFKSPEVLSGKSLHFFVLDFDFQPGHVISIQATGSLTKYNEVELENENGAISYHLSLRWDWSPTRLAFNTRQGLSWDVEEVLDNIPIINVSNYALDILVTDTEFKTYGDGQLITTNQQRYPFTNVRKLILRDFLVIHKVNVGPDACPSWSALH